MRKATSARILLGGKLTNYQGLWPGVLEEGVIALRTRQPLYPLGVFGGAARLLTDLLQGVDREEMTTAWFTANVPHREELVAEYRRHGRAVETPESLAAELKRAGAGGIAEALNNGLSDDENREFLAADDPQRVVALILEGLRRKLGT